MGGKPSKGTSSDLRLKRNNKNAGTGKKARLIPRIKKAFSKKSR